jgi:hypothetical protein
MARSGSQPAGTVPLSTCCAPLVTASSPPTSPITEFRSRHRVIGGRDFLLETDAPKGTEAIITNPPYTFAQAFIECALELMRPEGRVAMLLRTDYDHAKTRQHLFAGCPAFARKLVLTKRIVWFDGPRAAPSFNHCWMIWNWKHVGPPTLAYGPIT